MSFAEASAVTRVSDNRFRVEIQPGWDIFGISNGGYLMAILARAMGEMAPDRYLASISARFLNPASAGPAEVEVEVLKEGRNTTTLQGRMTAGDRTLFVGDATFTRPAESPGRLVSHGIPPDLPAPSECVRVLPSEDSPFPPPFTGMVDFRIHPDDMELGAGKSNGMPEVRGWLGLLDGELMDPYALVLSADAFPPAVFNSDLPVGWTPTIDMTVHIRRPGPHRRVACRFYTRFVSDGWLEEDGEIWDEDGNLVAQSRQLALLAR